VKKTKKIHIFNTLILIGLVFFEFSCRKIPENKNTISNQTIEPSPPPFKIDPTKTLKENQLIDYISKASKVKPNQKNGIPFNKLNYDKVIAYDFVGSEEAYSNIINEKGRFIPVVLAQKYLTQNQADNILSTLTKNATYGEATAACFNPHFALVLFKGEIKVNQINICLDCNYLTSEIEIPAETHKKVNKGEKDEYSITGFTNSGKKAIKDLCKELHFYYGRTK
jgi:hypothetical protein